MFDMTTPPKPTPAIHHGNLKWTCRWYDRTGKQRVKRFGAVNQVTRKAAYIAYADWMIGWTRQSERQAQSGSRCSVSQLCDEFRKYAKKKYRRGETLTSSYGNIDLALRDLTETFGERAADDVRAPEITKLRDQVFVFQWTPNGKKLDESGKPIAQTARTVNYRLLSVKQAYQHARGAGLISAETLLDVLSVKRVSDRDSIARASVDVKPVADDVVDATALKCSKSLADMIRVHRLTGMRPSEICEMRPCDIDVSIDDVWFYRPAEHKTDYAGKSRLIVIPPAAVLKLTPYLNRPTHARCFTPRDHAEQSGTLNRLKTAGAEWDHDSYRRAIMWACKRAGVDAWNPNQLRHAWATEVRRKIGIDAVREGLSHESRKTSEIYAELSRDRLVEMARKLG